MTWFRQAYRAVLGLAPAAYRRRFGDEATDVACRRVAERHGVGRIRTAVRELVDLLATVRRERRSEREAPRRMPGVPRASEWAAIGQDVRNAFRRLRATPGFTAIAVVILTLGMGASTAIFSVVDAVVLRGLPFDESDRIMSIGRVQPTAHRPGVETSATFLDWRGQQDVFESIAAYAGVQFNVRSDGTAVPETLIARRVTADLFPLLRVKPAFGQAFTAENEISGHQFVAVISDGLWRRRFGADPTVLGRKLTTDNGSWEIVGVMPPGFRFPIGQGTAVDVWMPFAPTPTDRTHTTGRNFTWSVIGRLKRGVTPAMAEARMQLITSALAKADPRWFRDADVTGVVPLRDTIVFRVRSWMLLLLAAVSLVLIIACVNVASLTLTRATAREREMAVRAALGGSRWRLARGLLVESLVLSAAGAVCGVLAAHWLVAVIKASMPQGVPRLESIAIDLRVFVVAAIAATVSAALFGIVPALLGSRADVTQALKDGGRSSTGSVRRRRLRTGLVIAEVTLAVVPLVGAGLFVLSFIRFASIDLGFDTRNVLTLDAYLNYRDPTWRTRGRPYVADVLGRLQKIPGVESAAAVVNGVPLTGSWNRSPITVRNQPPPSDPDGIQQNGVSPDYFTVMRIPLLRGRLFTSSDTSATQQVAIVNDIAERRYFGGSEALGQVVQIDNVDRVVVGIVRGIRSNGPDDDAWPALYVPIDQSEVGGADYLLRTTGPPLAVRNAAIAAVRSVRPEQVINEIQTMDGFFDVVSAQRRFLMQVFALFAGLGIVIAAAGIYGAMAHIVVQQTHEIGVRMALGARPAQVQRAVLGRAVVHVAIGLAIGSSAAWMLSRLVASLLYGVDVHERLVYVVVALLVLTAGALAAFVPARRAARLDPLIAMRME
jgi:putative ABC transport system permease protein